MNKIDFDDYIYCEAEDHASAELQFPKKEEGSHFVILMLVDEEVNRVDYQFQIGTPEKYNVPLEPSKLLRYLGYTVLPKDVSELLEDRIFEGYSIHLPDDMASKDTWIKISRRIGNIEKDMFILARREDDN